MSAETFTPAVERAAELLIHEAETTGLIREDVRNGLAAALDVEEMARTIHDHECGCAYDGEHTDADIERRDALATAVRTALLGADS